MDISEKCNQISAAAKLQENLHAVHIFVRNQNGYRCCVTSFELYGGICDDIFDEGKQDMAPHAFFLLFSDFFYDESCTGAGRAVIERAPRIAQSLKNALERRSWNAADGDQRQRRVQLALLTELVRTSKIFRARVVFTVVNQQNVCEREKASERDARHERLRDAAPEFVE